MQLACQGVFSLYFPFVKVLQVTVKTFKNLIEGASWIGFLLDGHGKLPFQSIAQTFAASLGPELKRLSVWTLRGCVRTQIIFLIHF
jgi:hypothetical protein